MHSHLTLRLLGSGSKSGTCPAVYAAETGELVVQGDITDRAGTVLVPHVLLDWLEPGMTLPVEAVAAPGAFLVSGEEITSREVLAQLRLADHETAVVVR
ncbi:hypothetical protein [Nocardia sp. CC227C]|uniref:hypothetical protein n=1 Tax=Nocardia sp. CC227C TaxID=3044562 RepID=UPI00278C7572|nr:hypothetical protein [Nocardia sp. CC227C]